MGHLYLDQQSLKLDERTCRLDVFINTFDDAVKMLEQVKASSLGTDAFKVLEQVNRNLTADAAGRWDVGRWDIAQWDVAYAGVFADMLKQLEGA